ncbi:MAG: hypothetical protein PHR25_05570 [Clostridia bacterium]|nr:hypothetical protein [Clostridia bacterium]MDD4376234.1 hypothetical protein [Clostridia bacterium]
MREFIKKKNIRVNDVISWIVRVLLVFAFIEALVDDKYENLFIIVLTFVMTFYPSILEKRLRVYLPSSLQVVITLFIFAAQFLGELKDFYYKISWWDEMLHFISGSILGIIGYMFVYFLNKKHIKETKLSPFFVTMFAFCFALTIGVFWEVFEFAADRLMGLNMQKFRLPGEDGLVDTMTDLIVDAIGALIVTTIGYIYMKDKGRIYSRKGKMNEWFMRQQEIEEKAELEEKG